MFTCDQCEALIEGPKGHLNGSECNILIGQCQSSSGSTGEIAASMLILGGKLLKNEGQHVVSCTPVKKMCKPKL